MFYIYFGSAELTQRYREIWEKHKEPPIHNKNSRQWCISFEKHIKEPNWAPQEPNFVKKGSRS